MDYSIENFADSIYHEQTKEYFKEVLVNYQSGSYRSSVVMLWAVVVCDLVYKLRHLDDVYDDKKAESILKEIETLQEKDPKSSAWELKLVSRVWKETELLSGSSFIELEHLQQQRHLSAHPIINEELMLHVPTKEMVRALIRSVLEGVLVKPPYLANNILVVMLKDLAENKSGLNTHEQVSKYVKSRYLARLTLPVKKVVFKSLWKLVFKTESGECNLNRSANLGLLLAIWSDEKEDLLSCIKADPIYYAKISPNLIVMTYLFSFLASNPAVYATFKDEVEIKVKSALEGNLYCRLVSWFVGADINAHFDSILELVRNPPYVPFAIPVNALDELLQISDEQGVVDRFYNFVSAYYCSSATYDSADSRFASAIRPYLKSFGRDNIINLIERIEGSTQTWQRGLSSVDHSFIYECASKLAPIQYDLYPNFSHSIRHTLNPPQ